MKTIKLTEKQWLSIRERIIEEHGNKIMISWVCRRELGFMVRQYDDPRNSYKTGYHIDFDDESSKTMFVLKYV